MASIDRLPAAMAVRFVPVASLLIAGYVAAAAALVVTSHAGVDAAGRPLGTDFANVWTAGRLVLSGAPEAAYDIVRHHAEQIARFGPEAPFYGWHYPPMFLGLAALLATLPYLAALAVWQATTLALYLAALVTIVGERRRDVLLAGLAFPAVFVNITHGHNGFLTAGLFGLALVLLDRRPALAGVLLGLLCYKPQFALLLPFVLVATGRWRTTVAAAATVVAVSALSLAAFGPETWAAFRASAEFTRTVVLEQGTTGWHKIVSVFSTTRSLGGSVALAYGAQGLATAAVVAATVVLWRSDAPFERKAAALLSGSLLVTPYALDYDLMLLGPALAFLARDAFVRGVRPWDVAWLVAAYASTLFGRAAADATLVPVGLIAVLAVFLIAVRRIAAAPSALPEPAHVQR